MDSLKGRDDKIIQSQRARRERRWRQQDTEWSRAPGAGLNEDLASRLRRRRAEAQEGNLVWPTEDEINNGKGDSD